MRMLMSNQERDAEMKALEAGLNEIADQVEEISEIASAKLSEMNDAIEAKKNIKAKNPVI